MKNLYILITLFVLGISSCETENGIDEINIDVKSFVVPEPVCEYTIEDTIWVFMGYDIHVLTHPDSTYYFCVYDTTNFNAIYYSQSASEFKAPGAKVYSLDEIFGVYTYGTYECFLEELDNRGVVFP